MGNLMTMTIRTDCLDEVYKNPQLFADELKYAVSSAGSFQGRLFNDCGAIICQQLLHADSHSMYVHMGNTVTEMHSYSKETQDLAKEFPDFFDRLVGHIERELVQLRKLQKPKVKVEKATKKKVKN